MEMNQLHSFMTFLTSLTCAFVLGFSGFMQYTNVVILTIIMVMVMISSLISSPLLTRVHNLNMHGESTNHWKYTINVITRIIHDSL